MTNRNRRGSSAKTDEPFDWGGSEDQFPQGMWDDFDGKVSVIYYEEGDYNTQIAIEIEPAEYEYTPRGLDPDETSDPKSWYSLGGGEFEVSEDGYKIIKGIPQRNTNAVKFVKLCREFGAKGLQGSDVEPLLDFNAHWSIVNWKGKIDGEERESNRLFPSGKAVGRAKAGSSSESGSGSRRSSGRRRRGQAEAGEGDEEPQSEEESPEEQQEQQPRRRGGRRSAATEESNGSTNGEEDIGAAIALLKEVVGEAGSEGIKRRGIASALASKETDDNGDIIKLAAQRSTVEAAKTDGVIEEDNSVLFLPEEADSK